MRSTIATLLLTFALTVSRAASSREQPLDLTALSIEELMDIEVTSVSKKPEKMAEAAAAVAVVTREDLRRAGATSIPEALRLVPGVQVAHFDANKWAISIRGFNSLFANKLLVLQDGRSKYNTMYSGVFWETLDLVLADVERIEVIRGSGATLWGANAVNGVINIITRHAADTQGTLLNAGFGTQERGFASFRYGGRLGNGVHYRVYARYFDRDAFVDSLGTEAADAWDVQRAGFRLDWDLTGDQALGLQGDIYRGDIGETMDLATPEFPFVHTPEIDASFSGGHLLGRWERTFSEVSEMKLQLYFDHTERDDAPLMTGYYQNFDVDLQHRLQHGALQELVWGLGYRLTRDDLDSEFALRYSPPRRTYHLLSAFVQNDLALVPDRLRLTLGSKFEHNTFSGFEVQPNLRLLWTPHERHTVWGAVSRAVRTPSRADHDIGFVSQVIPAGTLGKDTPLTFVVPSGIREFDSETLFAFELGYRLRPVDPLFLDLASFYNIYDGIRTYEAAMPFFEERPSPPHLVLPLYQGNKMFGNSHGAELAAEWMVRHGWRLRAAYTYLQMDLRVDDDSQYAAGVAAAEGESPNHQFFVCSAVDLPARLELDLGFRYVDELPTFAVDRYLDMDLRLGWKPGEGVRLSLVGQNLLHSHHPEYKSGDIPFFTTQVERGVYASLTLAF